MSNVVCCLNCNMYVNNKLRAIASIEIAIYPKPWFLKAWQNCYPRLTILERPSWLFRSPPVAAMLDLSLPAFILPPSQPQLLSRLASGLLASCHLQSLSWLAIGPLTACLYLFLSHLTPPLKSLLSGERGKLLSRSPQESEAPKGVEATCHSAPCCPVPQSLRCPVPQSCHQTCFARSHFSVPELQQPTAQSCSCPQSQNCSRLLSLSCSIHCCKSSLQTHRGSWLCLCPVPRPSA